MASSTSSDASSAVVSPFTRSLLSGALAGTTVDLSLYPLDTLKTRLQSSAGFVATGGFSGIYRGVGSAIVGSAPGAALFFVTYEHVKTYTATHTSWGQSAGAHMLAASLGEIAACAVRVPTEVIKQRAQARQEASSAAVLRAILARRKEQGHGMIGVWRELYRGWGITVAREVPFTMIQFPLWEALKRWQVRRQGRLDGTSTAGESAAFGAISGAVAAGLTTPLDVLKTRLMLAREKVSIMVLARSILAESGPRAFFAGIGPRIGWISAGGAIFLGSYQWCSNMLGADSTG